MEPAQFAYSTLLDRVAQGTIRIISIIAPPRSSSTALERALTESPDVDAQINEPWSIFDSPDRERLAYEWFLEKIEQKIEIPGRRPLTIIVKNIADYIPPGEAWKRWSRLADHHIFLIRNPLLCVESLFRTVSKELDGARIFAQNKPTADTLAVRAGYSSWNSMREAAFEARDYTSLETVLTSYFRYNQKIHDTFEMQRAVLHFVSDSLISEAGYAGCDEFALTKGFSSWARMLDELLNQDRQTVPFQEILERCFAFRITGWEALSEHLLSETDDSRVTLVDSTLLRLFPNDFLSRICQRSHLSYSDSLIQWSKETPFSVDYDTSSGVPYYDRVLGSSSISPPNEEALPLASFPPSFRRHLVRPGGALEIYFNLLRRAVSREELFFPRLFEGSQLPTLDPVMTYAVGLVETGDTQKVRDRLLEKLGDQRMSEFKEAFDCLDTIEKSKFKAVCK